MQNLISLNLSQQDLADLDGAIATLRRPGMDGIWIGMGMEWDVSK